MCKNKLNKITKFLWRNIKMHEKMNKVCLLWQKRLVIYFNSLKNTPKRFFLRMNSKLLKSYSKFYMKK